MSCFVVEALGFDSQMHCALQHRLLATTWLWVETRIHCLTYLEGQAAWWTRAPGFDHRWSGCHWQMLKKEQVSFVMWTIRMVACYHLFQCFGAQYPMAFMTE